MLKFGSYIVIYLFFLPKGLPHQDTAILIFTRTSSAEAKQKFLGKGLSHAISRQLCQRLIAKTRHCAEKTGFPVVEINSKLQVGRTIGARLSAAIEHVFEQGFKQILVIGTDTPNLSTLELQKAAQQVNNGKSVLGASTDGGVYLIGFQQSSFKKKEFTAIAWQTATVFNDLQAYFAQLATPVVQSSQALADIDGIDDLIAFIHQNTSTVLGQFLRKLVGLLSSKKSLQLPNVIRPIWEYNYKLLNRPPPVHI